MGRYGAYVRDPAEEPESVQSIDVARFWKVCRLPSGKHAAAKAKYQTENLLATLIYRQLRKLMIRDGCWHGSESEEAA